MKVTFSIASINCPRCTFHRTAITLANGAGRPTFWLAQGGPPHPCKHPMKASIGDAIITFFASPTEPSQ